MNPGARTAWGWLDSGNTVAALNMAVDEALLELAPDLARPVLRFYGWTEAGATFGYFQRIADIERITLLRPLIRRPTGGGLVPHAADWTYSLVFPVRHEWYELPAQESYRRAHAWLCRSFAALRVETELAACCLKAAPGQCFVGHEKHDLLWRGKKIAGAAQRRTRTGLLIQGSVQPPSLGLCRADWQEAMLQAGQAIYGAEWKPLVPDAALLQRAESLAAEKYTQPGYNRKK